MKKELIIKKELEHSQNPEILKQKIKQDLQQEIERDLQTVITLLEGSTDRQKIANYIKEYLLTK